MPILPFILLGIVFPAAVFSCKEEEEVALDPTAIVDVVEKQVTLNKTYISFLHSMAINLYHKPSDTKFEFSYMDDKQLAAALYERYTAIELNMTCWLCSLYYIYGKKYKIDILNRKKKSEKKAEKCANMAKLMSWYNQKSSVKMLVDAYGRGTGDKKIEADKKLVSLIVDAQILDTLLEKLKEVNDHFEQVFAQPPTYQEYFEDMLFGYIDYKEEDFLREIYGRLWAKLGSDYITVFNTMWLFLDHPQLVNPHGQTIPTLQQIKTKWREILKIEIPEKKFSDADSIVALEDTLFRTELVTRKLSVPENFGQRKWKIEEIDKDTKKEWIFKFFQT